MRAAPSVRPDRPAPLLLLLLLLGLAAGCSELTSPGSQSVAESELTFVRLADDAPEVADTLVSFWAVRGEQREVQIRYYYAGSGTYGKCLRFVVPAGALRERADGTPIAEGDSVRITVRMPDTEVLSFVFDPAGIRFDPADPATVEVVYRYAAEDLNGDGVVDAADAALRARFGFWRQERSGEPWVRVVTERLENEQEARASILGFTKYALASE